MRKRLSPLLVIAGLMAVLLAIPRGARAEITDKDLAERIVQTVLNYGQFSIFDDVSVAVDNRAVRLTGFVTIPVKRDEIGKRVAKIDGVRSVVNDIQVLPLSPMDSDIRLKVASAIYNHPTFWRYASMSLPPIHIIVDRGNVTLTGVVENQLDRNMAYALASQVPGSFSVKNNLKVER